MSAAPPHSSVSLPKLAIGGFNTDIDESDLIDLAKLYDCLLDTIGNVVGESNLKPLYEQLKRQIEATVKNDLLTCPDLDGNIDDKVGFV